jgi:adenosylmethionine-8-amino-7-oxononanoate aminotransferase
VAEVRGRGLLAAIEVVASRDTLARFEPEAMMTSKIVAEGLQRGVFFYAGGTGEVRDIVCMGPPFVISLEEIDHLVSILRQAVDAAVEQVD